MAFGTGTTKSTKKKSPTASELKKENAALKSEVEDLSSKLAAAELAAVKAKAAAEAAKNVQAPAVDVDAEKKYNQLRKAVASVCSHHPGFKEKIRAKGVLHLL